MVLLDRRVFVHKYVRVHLHMHLCAWENWRPSVRQCSFAVWSSVLLCMKVCLCVLLNPFPENIRRRKGMELEVKTRCTIEKSAGPI